MKTYIIYGKPIPLKRARVTRFGAYDPQKKEKEEHREMVYIQRGNVSPETEGPLELIVTFYMPIPKTTPKKILLQGTHHTKTPDIDNLVKYILDVIQPILLRNDSIVSIIIAEKVYDKNPRTEFVLHKVE